MKHNKIEKWEIHGKLGRWKFYRLRNSKQFHA